MAKVLLKFGRMWSTTQITFSQPHIPPPSAQVLHQKNLLQLSSWPGLPPPTHHTKASKELTVHMHKIHSANPQANYAKLPMPGTGDCVLQWSSVLMSGLSWLLQPYWVPYQMATGHYYGDVIILLLRQMVFYPYIHLLN